MIDQEFVDEYLKRLIVQYADKPKAIAEIKAYLEEYSQIYNFMYAILNGFDLDKAWGHRLDLIGAWVGQSRTILNAVPKVYFGFADNANAVGFDNNYIGESTIYDERHDVGYTATELNDTQYRFFIKIRIAENITTSKLMTCDGKCMQDIVRFIFDGKAYVVDNMDMTMTIYIHDSFNQNFIDLIDSAGLFINPQGVKIIIKRYR